MGFRQRRGGLIPRSMEWARRMAGGAPTGDPARRAAAPVVPPNPERPPALADQLELAQRRLKDTIPPPSE